MNSKRSLPRNFFKSDRCGHLSNFWNASEFLGRLQKLSGPPHKSHSGLTFFTEKNWKFCRVHEKYTRQNLFYSWYKRLSETSIWWDKFVLITSSGYIWRWYDMMLWLCVPGLGREIHPSKLFPKLKPQHFHWGGKNVIYYPCRVYLLVTDFSQSER